MTFLQLVQQICFGKNLKANKNAPIGPIFMRVQ